MTTVNTATKPRRRRGRALLPVAAVLLALGAAPAGRAAAHDTIAGSDPEQGARLDEPISEVTIDFGEEIADEPQLALLYDTGDGEIEELGGTASRSGPTTGRLEFDPLEREGRYFVRYLATVPVDGHVVAGAINFDFGEPRGSGATELTPWIVFGLAAVVVGGGGGGGGRPAPGGRPPPPPAWLSRRRHVALTAATGADPSGDDVEEPGGDADRPADDAGRSTVTDRR
jgi:methionine-rich copper-binding protein CopC